MKSQSNGNSCPCARQPRRGFPPHPLTVKDTLRVGGLDGVGDGCVAAHDGGAGVLGLQPLVERRQLLVRLAAVDKLFVLKSEVVCVNVCVCVCVCMCVRACVRCVCVRERDRDRQRDRQTDRVCVCESVCVSECVSVCACMWCVHECVYVCVCE